MSSKVEIDEISELNKDIERYLASLYESNEFGNARVSTTELSKILKSHPSTVSNRLKLLSEMMVSNYKIIDYEKNYGAKLTYFGSIIGGKIVRKKRIKELFLKQLGMSLMDIDANIDHIHVTERISKLIKSKILDPLISLETKEQANIRCPHGALLPDEGGKSKPEIFFPLSYFPEGAVLTVHRLSANIGMLAREDFYAKIQTHELYPGTKLTWINNSNRNTTFTKNAPENQFTIKTKIAELIYYTDREYDYIIP